MSSNVGGTGERESARPRNRRITLQWSLQTLLLLTAVVAVWTGYLHYRREIPQLEQEIEAMRWMTRELIVEDPHQAAVVKLDELWMDDHRWDVYLPEGTYVIRLATRKIGKQYPSPVTAEAPIAAGRHRIELQRDKGEEGWKITVLVDDEPSIETAETPDWDPGHGSEGSGGFSISTQLPPDKPIDLHRLRFKQATKPGQYKAPQEPTEGLLLWIERVEERR
jgi:hypothetical protein